MRGLKSITRPLCLGLLLPLLVGAEEGGLPDRLAEGKERFETHCGTCHSLALPKSQRLNRANWEWVIDDMVNQYGAEWLTEEDQALILDYLVHAYGPEEPR